MKLKVFEVPFWAKNKIEPFLECVDEKITPILNRNGLYLDRETKTCWIECKFGAYLYKNGYNQALYELNLLNHRPLMEKEIKAIRYLIISRIANKELKQLYYTDREWKNLRNITQTYKKTLFSLKKEIQT